MKVVNKKKRGGLGGELVLTVAALSDTKEAENLLLSRPVVVLRR